MTSRLKKKSNKSSLDSKYLVKFVNTVEEKLYQFNIGFLTPYKKKLDSLDTSVIKDIEKDLKAPTAIIKSALDELWNYHWILGQKDVIQHEGKKAQFNSNNTLITFNEEANILRAITDAKTQREQLKRLNIEVVRQEKELAKQLSKPTTKQDLAKINNIDKTLDFLSDQLNQFLGFIDNKNKDKRTQKFKSVEVRARDLQESVRNMELKIASRNISNVPRPRDIDILNSSEFGTIYQEKRTLVLGTKYSQDHKESIVNSIKKYFNNVATNKNRPNTRESTLFKDLTRNTLDSTDNSTKNKLINISRVKRIAETEISLAYNLGRLKKLEDLGYRKVRVVNEAENRNNRTTAINTFGSIPKAYQSETVKAFMPILCTYCKEKNGEEFLISELYKPDTATRYGEVESNGKFYSAAPPFHVSCWCYFVGVEQEEEDKEPSLLSEVSELLKNQVIANSLANPVTKEDAFYDDPFVKKLIIGGVGLLGVGVAYVAYSKLSRNRVKVPTKPTTQAITSNTPRIKIPNDIGTQTSDNPNLNPYDPNRGLTPLPDLVEENQRALLRSFVDNLDENTMQELLDFADELPESINTSNIKDPVIKKIDSQLANRKFPVGKLLDFTIKDVLVDNSEYIGNLGTVLKSKRDYETIRDRIIRGQLDGLDLDKTYKSYLEAKQNYESKLKQFLEATRTKKSNVTDINANLNISAKQAILSNREVLPQDITLEDALNNLKSTQVLNNSNKQLKNIERNLNKEVQNIGDLQSRESRLVDQKLKGVDTRTRAEQLRNTSTTIKPVVKATKTLDSVVNNVNRIKRELNDNRLNMDTIRTISKQRLDSSSLVDRAALIDTQKTYTRQVLAEKEKVIGQLQKFDNVDNLENFSRLYRSEISNKAKTGYQYSRGIWSEADIEKLDSTYKDISNVLTIKKSYESYLFELDDMLEKLNSFERTVSSDIQFSSQYEQSKSLILLNKVRLIPSKNTFKLKH